MLCPSRETSKAAGSGLILGEPVGGQGDQAEAVHEAQMSGAPYQAGLIKWQARRFHLKHRNQEFRQIDKDIGRFH